MDVSDKAILNWVLSMQDSRDYLNIDSLTPNMAYALWARNAYVGIWMPDEKTFLISRYKICSEPYLSVEGHWDIGEPLGTAKPLYPLEKAPLNDLSLSSRDDLRINVQLCAWLEALETKNPPLPGWDSVNERRLAAASFRQRWDAKSKLSRS